MCRLILGERAHLVAQNAHRRAGIQSFFDFFGKRKIFDIEINKFEAVFGEFVGKSIFRGAGQFVVLRCKIKRGNARFGNDVGDRRQNHFP